MSVKNVEVNQLENILQGISDWIRAADQKVSILLALQGIILTLLIPDYLKTTTGRFQANTISVWNGILFFFATSSLVIAILIALIAIFPKLNNKVKSHLYFGGIKNMSLEQYKDDMKHLTNGEYFDELCEQIHTNSGIASRKHKLFQKSIWFFIIGMILFVISNLSLKFF